MRAYPIAMLALALLAGTAGYITHRVLSPPTAPAAVENLSLTPAAVPGSARPAAPLAWTFATPEGERRALDSWPGEIVVLNFWATWCPPCLREIPAFIDLQRRYGERGLQFIGIALDQPQAVLPFMAEKSINYPVVVGDEQVVQLMQTLGNEIGGLPYTVVLRDGEVVFAHQGEWTAEDAESTLSKLLPES